MTYYCSYYAARIAIDAAPKLKTSQDFLVSLLNHLETEKVKLSALDAVSNEVVGYAHVENFALKIFNKADAEDRGGLATPKTAKTFHAASIFLELLKIFGDVDSDVKFDLRRLFRR